MVTGSVGSARKKKGLENLLGRSSYSSAGSDARRRSPVACDCQGVRGLIPAHCATAVDLLTHFGRSSFTPDFSSVAKSPMRPLARA
jgi:hypothetical protein